LQQLTGQDSSMLYVESGIAPNHVTGLSIYDPSTSPDEVTFATILERIRDRLPRARAFRQRLVRVPFDLDHPYWVEDGNFDLEFHVRQLALPDPGDWRQLCTQVSRLHSRPLDLARPPWELYVIEGLDTVDGIAEGSFALVLKVHHSAIDGAAGVEIINAIHDQSADAPSAPDEDGWEGESPPNAATLLSRAALHGLGRPPRLVRQVLRGAPIVGRLPFQVRQGQFSLPTVARPFTRFNGTVSAHRVMDGCRFPLSTFREVKRAVDGCTVNDVALAVVAGAMRSYLSAKGELPDASLGAVCPVSLRSRNEAATVAGNDIGAMSVTLHTDLADPLARLEAVVKSTADSKERKRAIGARTLVEFSDLLPGALLGIGFRAQSRIARRLGNAILFNTTVTNVPASPTPIFFAGARMTATYGLGPIFDGMGLLHLVCSYAGEMTVSFTSDRELLPDPAFYAQCIAESMAELAAAAAATMPSARKSR
jgi:diacylglycerol O-acyltransferase / wax synthase